MDPKTSYPCRQLVRPPRQPTTLIFNYLFFSIKNFLFPLNKIKQPNFVQKKYLRIKYSQYPKIIIEYGQQLVICYYYPTVRLINPETKQTPRPPLSFVGLVIILIGQIINVFLFINYGSSGYNFFYHTVIYLNFVKFIISL